MQKEIQTNEDASNLDELITFAIRNKLYGKNEVKLPQNSSRPSE